MADRARLDVGARWRGWLLLVGWSAAITTAFNLLSLPAALLLGPMLAGIVVAARGHAIAIPRGLASASHAVVGCLIAAGMAGALGPVVREHWMLFAGLALATIGTSGAIGYGLSRLRIVPGTVAIWGSMPGGAAAMVLMAEANGADPRLVAVMTYTRVVTVTLAATGLAALIGGEPQAIAGPVTSDLASFSLMIAVALAGVAGAALFRWPAGTLVVTIALGVLVQSLGGTVLRVPATLLVVAFAAIGWRIGLSFTGEARGSALQMLPRIAVAAVLLSGICGLLAAAMHYGLGIDPLTAWLAASPGGLESVAVIASSLPVDTPFIMAAQTARFALVMLIGPALGTALSRHIHRREEANRQSHGR